MFIFETNLSHPTKKMNISSIPQNHNIPYQKPKELVFAV